MILASMFRSEKCVWALNKSLELCILLDTLDWDGRYVKATPQLQAEYDQASRTFFDKLKVFKVMVDSISSRSWALLLWTDRRLQFLADQESIGPGAKVQEVRNPELAQLLQQREAAYVAAFMALKQWEVVQAACLDVDQKGQRRWLEDDVYAAWEVGTCEYWSPCLSEKAAKRWVPALMMTPGSDLCQELSSKVPAWVHERSRCYPGDFYRSMAYHHQKSL